MDVKNLSFQHTQNSSYFFEDLSFSLEPGKLHALHGKNGMGKTVLLQILAGQNPHGSKVKGTITQAGNIALIPQRFDASLAGEFSFIDNLRFARLSRFPLPFQFLKPAPSYDRDILDRFHIDPLIPVKLFSGGQRQILAVMATLQKKKRVLLLDEPTAAMDEENAKMVFEYLKGLTGITFLIVCHDSELVYRYVNGRHLKLSKDEKGIRKIMN